MGVFARLRRSRKTIFVCIFSSALFFCVWIFVQEETPKRRLVAYDQQIDELFSNSPLFNLKEVKESDVRLWQGKFYSSLESAISKRLTKRGKALAVYACNQSHLRDINQITLPGNESRQAVETISQNGLVHFLEKASCKPMNPDVVLYNRIYKTGSETTRALFCFVAAMMDYSYTKETKEEGYDYDKGQLRAYQEIIEHKVNQTDRQIIQRRLPYFLPVLPEELTHFKLNEGTNKFNSSCVSKEMIEKIKQANWLDIELYEFVKEIFWKQVKACGIL